MKYYVTDHAAERYISRVKSHYDTEQAKKELRKLAGSAKALDLEKYPGLDPDTRWIELSEGIFAPVVREGEIYGIMTVMTRGGYAEEQRIRKNKRSQDRRYARNMSHKRREKHQYKRERLDLDEG